MEKTIRIVVIIEMKGNMRKNPSITTIKEVFAFSGNTCAFPGCNQQIFDDNHNFIGEICHIEAANPGGERYNPNQTDDERASIDNLILLCANHHLVTNNVSVFSVEALKEMKKWHEEKSKERRYSIDEKELNQVLSSIDERISDVSKNILSELNSSKEKRYEMKVKFCLLIGIDLHLLVAITGMNTGDRPITLSSWGFELPNRNYITGRVLFPEPVRFPYKLQPGESITVAMEKSKVAAQLEQAGYPDTTCLLGFFKDQIDNKYSIMSESFNNF